MQIWPIYFSLVVVLTFVSQYQPNRLPELYENRLYLNFTVDSTLTIITRA